jgi:hypothetical protein
VLNLWYSIARTAYIAKCTGRCVALCRKWRVCANVIDFHAFFRVCLIFKLRESFAKYIAGLGSSNMMRLIQNIVKCYKRITDPLVLKWQKNWQRHISSLRFNWYNFRPIAVLTKGTVSCASSLIQWLCTNNSVFLKFKFMVFRCLNSSLLQ